MDRATLHDAQVCHKWTDGSRRVRQEEASVMDWDDVRPKPKAEIVVGEKLEALSVDELTARIAALEAEIDRVRAELDVKRNRVAAAQSLFKD
jgi:uncharacterized small protein (DUF1192 family)